MKKIRSNKPLVVDSRANKVAIVEVEITEWNYNAYTETYIVCVKDSSVEMIEGEEVKTQIALNNKIYSKGDIDGLFTALATPISLDESYSSQLDTLITNALLMITQGDPIYGSEPQDWEVVVD